MKMNKYSRLKRLSPETRGQGAFRRVMLVTEVWGRVGSRGHRKHRAVAHRLLPAAPLTWKFYATIRLTSLPNTNRHV